MTEPERAKNDGLVLDVTDCLVLAGTALAGAGAYLIGGPGGPLLVVGLVAMTAGFLRALRQL